MTPTFEISDFKRVVERHWHYHALCRTLMWNAIDGDGSWQIEVAPAFQEVVGGEQDGMKVWAGFQFDVSAFLAERGVRVVSVLAASYCVECAETPSILIKGSYFGDQFSLKLHLEPVPNTKPMEVIDVLKHQVQDIQERQR